MQSRKRYSIHQGVIIWYVDDLGYFHWGSPLARQEGLSRDAAKSDLPRRKFQQERRQLQRKQPPRSR